MKQLSVGILKTTIMFMQWKTVLTLLYSMWIM